MLREILDIYGAEVAQTCVKRDEGRLDALDLHTLEQVLREVHSGRRCGHGAFVLGEYGLVALGILGLDLLAHPSRQGRLAQTVERRLELVVRAVEEEAQRTAARGGVVDHLGAHHVVVAEVELVPYSYLSGRINQNVPQTQLAVELAQQEDLDLGARLLLVSVEACGEYLRVVEDEDILLLEIVDYILENSMFDLARGSVYHHQTRLVAVFGGVFGQHVGREIVSVLRQLHDFMTLQCPERHTYQNILRYFPDFVSHCDSFSRKKSRFSASSTLNPPLRVRRRAVR